MKPPGVVIHTNADLLAAAVAARLVTRVVDAQAARGEASVVLTGGGIGIAVLHQLAAAPAVGAIDWSRVELYWGDERFLPAGHPDRNETQAREALLDHVGVPSHRVHPMGASGGPLGDDPDVAARDYAELLARQARPEDHGDVPAFDVCLLGIGEEGHVASIFPGSPAAYETERTVVGVRGCPKWPPLRVSLTLPAIRAASEVWVVAAGESKAGAASMALAGAGEVQLPAAGVAGRRRTLWLLDRAAAAKLPREFTPPRV